MPFFSKKYIKHRQINTFPPPRRSMNDDYFLFRVNHLFDKTWFIDKDILAGHNINKVWSLPILGWVISRLVKYYFELWLFLFAVCLCLSCALIIHWFLNYYEIFIRPSFCKVQNQSLLLWYILLLIKAIVPCVLCMTANLLSEFWSKIVDFRSISVPFISLCFC